MVTVGVFEFCGMRCQPLRRALCFMRKYDKVRDNFDDHIAG